MEPEAMTSGEPTSRSSRLGLLDDYLSLKQAADELGVTTRTMQEWHPKGRGPRRTLIGGRVYFHVDDLRRWIEDQKEALPKARRRGRR